MSIQTRSFHTMLHPDPTGKALHVLGEIVVDGTMTINNIKVGDASGSVIDLDGDIDLKDNIIFNCKDPSHGNEIGDRNYNDNRYCMVADGYAPSSTETTANAALPMSGGTMSGNLDMGQHILWNVKDPTNDNQVGDRAYNDARYAPASTVATANAAVPKSGGTMSGNLNIGQSILWNVKDPTQGDQVGDRAYNDGRYAPKVSVITQSPSYRTYVAFPISCNEYLNFSADICFGDGNHGLVPTFILAMSSGNVLWNSANSNSCLQFSEANNNNNTNVADYSVSDSVMKNNYINNSDSVELSNTVDGNKIASTTMVHFEVKLSKTSPFGNAGLTIVIHTSWVNSRGRNVMSNFHAHHMSHSPEHITQIIFKANPALRTWGKGFVVASL